MNSSALFYARLSLIQIFYHLTDVGVDTNRLIGDFIGAVALAEIYTDICGVLVLRRQLPERIFYDDRGVILIEHRFACFLCRAIVILLYTAVSDRRDIVTGFAADVTDESVINIDLHNNLAVLLFLFMDHDAINQRMQQFFG